MYSQNELDIAILPLSDSSIILGNPIYRKTFTHSETKAIQVLFVHNCDPLQSASPELLWLEMLSSVVLLPFR